MSDENDILSNEKDEQQQPTDPMTQAYEHVMGTESGRMVLSGILEMAGFFSNTFNVDANANAHNSGMRSIASNIWQEMGAASKENRIKMMQEAEADG